MIEFHAMERNTIYPITDRKEKAGRAILTVNNISLSKGQNQILDNVNFSLNFGDHVAIVGPNGVGKTTLLNIIAGIEEQDAGKVVLSQNINFVYVPQSIDKTLRNLPNITVLEYFKEARGLSDIEMKMLEMEQNFLDQNKQTKIALQTYGELQMKFQSLGGFTIESESEALLEGIGLSKSADLNTSISKLSGGEKTKLVIAQALISNADLLLLDEPSNHLDSDSKKWLAEQLRNYKGTTIIISHDEDILKTFTQKVIELSPDQFGAEVYIGDYSSYLKQRQNKNITAERAIEKTMKKISKLSEVANRLRAGRSARISTDRQKKLEKIKNDIPDSKYHAKVPRMVFEVKTKSGVEALQVENLAKVYSDKTITYPSFEIKRGEKLVISGPVGSGKSTLLKIITGIIKEDFGQIRFGQNVDIGYYSQEMDDLNTNRTVIEEVKDIAGNGSEQKIRNLLGAFLFQGDDVFKQIEVLSYGERSRLMLAKLAMNKHNFLILDEPTNHLDAISRDVVAEMIKNFEGTVMLVSHDKNFINKINTNHTIILK